MFWIIANNKKKFCVPVFLILQGLCVLQNRKAQLDRKSHYLNSSTVSPVISLRAFTTYRLYLCVGVECVFLCVSEKSKETNLHHCSHSHPCTGSVYHKISLMKIHAAETKPERIKFLCSRRRCVSAQEGCTCMYVQGFKQDGGLINNGLTHVFSGWCLVPPASTISEY